MTASAEMLFDDARKELLREIDSSVGHVPCHDAFAAWLLPHHSHLPDLASLASLATTHLQSDRRYHHHAVIGFAAYTGAATESAQKALASGLLWLAGRPPRVDGNPMAFCTDAIALLGIALGTHTLGDQSIHTAVAEWMSQFLEESYKMPGVQDWQRCLFAVTQYMVRAGPQLLIPVTPLVADIRVALYSKGLPLRDLLATKQDEEQVFSLLKT